jgi:hypothetical protein
MANAWRTMTRFVSAKREKTFPLPTKRELHPHNAGPRPALCDGRGNYPTTDTTIMARQWVVRLRDLNPAVRAHYARMVERPGWFTGLVDRLAAQPRQQWLAMMAKEVSQ